MKAAAAHDHRVDEIADVMVRLTAGQLSARVVPSGAGDELDAIMVGLNWLAEELELRESNLQRLVAERTAELERSNKELEQFAYIASHDLQEPLRMVSSYTMLLKRRYQERLDKDADEFIDYAVDGVLRMQALINDLLAYSRAGRGPRPSEPTDSADALGKALRNLEAAIRGRDALISAAELPTVMAGHQQLVQLFQNLIGNAIKFCPSDRRPEIQVSAQPQPTTWLFAVRDNGIGIDPTYADRIFQIFQRLHRREDYPGTGIGLAICKKIVERQGGRIWVESSPGNGATFFFSLPAAPSKELAA